jgi:NTE family protein
VSIQTNDGVGKYAAPLKKLNAVVQERIINWGYAVCDAAIRTHVDPTAPLPAGFPYAAVGVG